MNIEPTLKIKTLNDALKISVNHMWRESSCLDLNDQIAVRQFRVKRLIDLQAPEIILGNEQKQLRYLLNRRNKLKTD